MKKKWTALAAGTMLSAIVLAACGGDDGNSAGGDGDGGGNSEGLDTRIVTIATGGASGPYNIIGTTLASEYSDAYGVNSKPQTTGASVENINLIKEGKVEMAFVMSDVLTEAVDGTGNFSEPVDQVQQIAALYPNFVQIVTTADSGIETVDDLKGKRWG